MAASFVGCFENSDADDEKGDDIAILLYGLYIIKSTFYKITHIRRYLESL